MRSGAGVGEAVAHVEARAVTAFAEASVDVDSKAGLFGTDWDDLRTAVVQKSANKAIRR